MMKRMQEERGSIAVFLLICLLPMLMFESLIIDGVRILASRGNVQDAANLALEGGLASYDRDLKEAYGLYAISGENQFKSNVNKYFQETIGREDHFAQYKDRGKSFLKVDAKVNAGFTDGSQLSNKTILKSQIWNYMKYYAVTDSKETEYMYMGNNYMLSACVMIHNRFVFDKRYAETNRLIEEGFTDESINTYINELESIFNVWEQNLSYGNLSETGLAAMHRELESSRQLLEDTKKRAADLKAKREAEKEAEKNTEDGEEDDQEEEEEEEEDEGPSPAAIAKENEVMDMFRYGDMKHTQFVKFSETYPENNPDQCPVSKDELISVEGDLNDMWRNNFNDIGKVWGNYINETSTIKRYTEGWSIEEAVGLYAGSMFTCFISPTKSLSGNDHFTGKIKSNNYSELEYILCGGSDPNENLEKCMSAWQEYLTLWCLVENFMADGTDQAEALEAAKIMAGKETYRIPLYRDYYLWAKAYKDGYDKLRESINPANGYKCTIYQEDKYYVVKYRQFLQKLVVKYASEHMDAYLERIQNVIERNMQNAGYRSFSFDSEYTVGWIEVDATIPTVLLPKQTTNYKYASGY